MADFINRKKRLYIQNETEYNNRIEFSGEIKMNNELCIGLGEAVSGYGQNRFAKNYRTGENVAPSKTFKITLTAVSSLESMCDLLDSIRFDRDKFIILEYAEGEVRRLSAVLTPLETRWMFIDYDGIGKARYDVKQIIVDEMPLLIGQNLMYQFTSSHDLHGTRLRLGLLNDSVLTYEDRVDITAELKAECDTIDKTMSGRCRVIYTADGIYKGRNPFHNKTRTGVIQWEK